MTEREIFLSALEIEDPAVRQAHVQAACAGDSALQARVESLLTLNESQSPFLETPVAQQMAGEIDADSGRTVVFADSSTDHELIPTEFTPDRSKSICDKNDDESIDSFLAYLQPSDKPGSVGRLAHYEVLQVLGRGAFGIVLKAFDEKLQRIVAIKMLAPEMAATSPARKRFLREARSSAQIRHDNVVYIHSVEETPLPYLVMEHIPGQSLQHKLDGNGPLDALTVVRIGRQIAEGLAAAHAQGLIHRDIKPGNILLESGVVERVKITDFGLARTADDASVTQSGLIAGTPMYMAPEQAYGKELDQRADLFSLGSVLYQMVSGRPPFRAANTLAVLKRVAEDEPRPIREIIPETPAWLCDIISMLHAKQPQHRYQTAREVADVLANCEAQLKTHTRLHDFSKIPVKTPERGFGQWKGAVAVVLLVPVLVLAVTEIAGVTHLFLGEPAIVDRTLARSARDPSVPMNPPGTEAGQAQPDINREMAVNISTVDTEPQPISPQSANDQVEAVRKELVRLNPRFDGKLTPRIENEIVTELSINTDEVENLVPVRAFTRLVYLDVRGTYPNKGKLSDLSPIKGMKITRLDCSSTQVADLTPIAGMSLTFLQFNHNPVSDLSPLKNMPLEELGCAETLVSDLTPLKGMKLQSLGAQLLAVTDLSPLAEMPLTGLDLYHTIGVTDLSPLQGMPLKGINLQDVPVLDLTPLKGMNTLRSLVLKESRVSDLSPLEGLQLTDLFLHDKQITDLSPLKGMPLHRLFITGSGVTDLTPLQGAPLHEIQLNPGNITQGMGVLRDMGTLESIGADDGKVWPPKEFWERYDKGEFKSRPAPAGN